MKSHSYHVATAKAWRCIPGTASRYRSGVALQVMWKLSRVHVDMRVYFDIGCKTSTHRVGVRFVLVAVSVLLTVYLV